MIPFNVPPYCGNEDEYVLDAIHSHRISGNGPYTKKCNNWIENSFRVQKALLTTSGSTALDMAYELCGLKPGDEVILPSYTFPSTANAAVLCGAKLVFVDIRPDTMNIDENKIEAAITNKTKAICVVHYAGVSCEMDTIMNLARKHNLKVIEDAAQGVFSTYKGKYLGTIGDFGCYSFHETKNFSMGEGGAILINDKTNIEKAEILWEKGTNRSKFFRGQVDKYNWIEHGDSYLPSEMNAAYLWAQLEHANEINQNRMESWKCYNQTFLKLKEEQLAEIPTVPDECCHNAHMYYLKCKDLKERSDLIAYLKEKDILSVFHYVPLHSAPAGIKYGRFEGKDEYTTRESERLVRLPLYYNLKESDRSRVIAAVLSFYMEKKNNGL